MDKIMRDIRKIIKLANKIIPELKRGDIRRVRKHLEGIIAFDIDELRRLQKEHGDRRIIDECIIVLREAKIALKDTKSFQTLEEAKKLVEHIEKIEEWEYANIRLRSHHIPKILGYHLDPKLFELSDREYLAQMKEVMKKLENYPDDFYSKEWFLNMREIFRRLRDNPDLKFEFVTGSDSLCALCGHRKECINLNHVYHKIANDWDRKTDKDHLELKKGKFYGTQFILELYRRKGWLK